jgi:hypothetical protein
MKFKTTQSAIKQQLGLIAAQQHSLENRYGGQPTINRFSQFIEGFIDHTAEQVRGCSGCHNTAMRPVNITRVGNDVRAVWKCSVCGREAQKVVTEDELKEDFKGQKMTA